MLNGNGTYPFCGFISADQVRGELTRLGELQEDLGAAYSDDYINLAAALMHFAPAEFARLSNDLKSRGLGQSRWERVVQARARQEHKHLLAHDKPKGAPPATTDRDAIENAIAEVEAAATAPQRAQYIDDQGRLVHGIPLGEKLALVKGAKEGLDREVELIAEPEILPTSGSFSTEGLRRYRDGAIVSLGDVVNRLHDYIKTRMVFRWPWQSRLCALWVFGTYMHVIFEYYAYLHSHGATKRAGKSKLLEVLCSLAFNADGVDAEPTPAVIYRDANRNSATQLFDELEKMSNEDQKAAVMAILNVGFKRGATVKRVLDPQADTMRRFDVFSPKAFASIKPLSDTTGDRSIKIELLRKKTGEKIKRSGNLASRIEATRLRDDCHIAALQCAGVVEQVYEGLAESLWDGYDDVDDRARDILEPLFAIALVVDDGDIPTCESAMREAARAIAGVRMDVGNDETNLIAATEALLEYSADRDSFAITGDQAFELLRRVDELSWLDGAGGAKALLRKLGLTSSTHRRSLFVLEPKAGKETVKGYLVKRSQLTDFIDRYRPAMVEADEQE